MKICEILPENELWLKIRNSSINLTESYNEIIWLLNFLIQQKSQHRNNVWLPTIDTFEESVRELLNTEFPVESDLDVIMFKKTAIDMLKTIKQLKSQLVL
jgi:hypothetical protein